MRAAMIRSGLYLELKHSAISRQWCSFQIARDSPGTPECGSRTVDSRLSDLARSQSEIWLDRMPTSPTSRFYVQVDWLCKHWPVGSSTGAVAGDTRGIQTSARPSHVVFQKGCRKSNRRGGLLKRPKPCNSCHSRSQSPRESCLLSH